MKRYSEAEKAAKAFPAEVNRRLRQILARVVDVHFDGSPSEAAKVIGVSQPHVSQLRQEDNDRGFGPLIAIQLAKFLDADMRDMVDMSVDIDALVYINSQKRVRLEAKKFAEKAGVSKETIQAIDERYAGSEKSVIELVALMLEREAKKYRSSNTQRQELDAVVSRLVANKPRRSRGMDE